MWVSVVKGPQSCGPSDFEDDPIICDMKQGRQNSFQISNFEVLQTLKNLTGMARHGVGHFIQPFLKHL